MAKVSLIFIEITFYEINNLYRKDESEFLRALGKLYLKDVTSWKRLNLYGTLWKLDIKKEIFLSLIVYIFILKGGLDLFDIRSRRLTQKQINGESFARHSRVSHNPVEHTSF